MYSLVLMAAMTSTAQTPAIFFGGGGCSGCRGGFLGLNLFFGGRGCSGCGGSSYGCSGRSYSCHGGCGGNYYAAPANYGHCHGAPYQAYGSQGGWNAPVAPPVQAQSYSSPASHTSKKPVETIDVQPKKVTPSSQVEWSPARARLIVEVPADARVFINDQPTLMANGIERQFLTPELEANQEYYYMLRSETVRNGKTIAENQRIIVRAGQEFRASFADKTETTQLTSVMLTLKD